MKYLKSHPVNHPKREEKERPERAVVAKSIINLLSADLPLLASPVRYLYVFRKKIDAGHSST